MYLSIAFSFESTGESTHFVAAGAVATPLGSASLADSCETRADRRFGASPIVQLRSALLRRRMHQLAESPLAGAIAYSYRAV